MSEEGSVEGPEITNTPEMMSKVVSKMKHGKAAGPSGIYIEMTKTAGDGVTVWHHSSYMYYTPDYWDLSYIINLFIEKQGALSCENYRGLKLQENVMKIL